MKRLAVSPRIAVLLLLLAAAVWLRLAGITWGLPQTFNSDEPHIVNSALAYASSFPRPYDFKYPALWPTVLFFFYGLYFVVWSGFGLLHRVGDFIGLYGWNPGGFFLIGRGLASLCSLLGVVAIARFESEWRGRRWPWAAIALAVAPAIVEAAHSCKPDCMMMMWCCLAWVAGIQVQRTGDRRAHHLCGLFIGLAVSTQYTAAPLAALLPAASLLSFQRSKRRWLWEGIAAAAAAFLITSPYTLIDFPRFRDDMKDFADLLRMTSYDPVVMRRLVALNYWKFAGPGSMAGLLSIFGLTFLARRDWKLAAVFAIPLVLQWIAVSRYPDGTWPRYLMAVFPALALLCAEAFDAIESFQRPLLTLLAFALAFVPGFLRAAIADAGMRLPDTRPLAAQWIKDNVPAGSSLLLDLPHASPNLVMSKDEIDELAAKTAAAGSPRARLYRGMAATHPGGGYRIFRIRRGPLEMYSLPGMVERSQADNPTVDVRPGLDMARAMRIDYVVTTDWGADPRRVPELRTFFDEVYSETNFVKDFVPAPGETAGPVLRVFKLR